MTRRSAITVILPCRDAEDTVGLAVRSVLRQRGVPDLRLLAMEDGSRDGTAKVLADLARRDSRLTVIRQQRLGLVEALNRALRRVETPYVARQDADDVSHPLRLASQLDLFRRHPQNDVVGCRIHGFPRPLVRGGMRRYERWQNGLVEHAEMAEELFIESPIAHASALMKTESVLGVGGFRQIDGPEDWDLWARMFDRGCRFAKVPRKLYFWREHKKRLSRTDPRLAADSFRALKCSHLAAGPLRGISFVELWSHGRQGEAWSKLLEGLGSFEFRYRPLNPKPIRSGQVQLPPFPLGKSGLVLVAYGTQDIRKWFRKKMIDLGGRAFRDYLLIG